MRTSPSWESSNFLEAPVEGAQEPRNARNTRVSKCLNEETGRALRGTHSCVYPVKGWASLKKPFWSHSLGIQPGTLQKFAKLVNRNTVNYIWKQVSVNAVLYVSQKPPGKKRRYLSISFSLCFAKYKWLYHNVQKHLFKKSVFSKILPNLLDKKNDSITGLLTSYN